MVDKVVEDGMKGHFLKQWKDYMTQQDENSAAFEFEYVKDLTEFIEILFIFYSDYSIRISQTSGHPTIQVFMRLEEGLWKAK